MPIQTIRSQRLYRQIADQLQQLINDGEFPPGALLPPERELAQSLGVSRASVREALIALEVVGQVAVRVGHGVVVLESRATPLEPVMRAAARTEAWALDPEFESEIELNLDEEIPPFSLLQTRRYMEPEITALAAMNATDDDLKAIRLAFERNVSDNANGGRNCAGDRLLHIRIAEASGNAAYALVIKHLLGHQYGAMFRRLQELFTETDMPQRSQDDHERIVNAIESRDPIAARHAMEVHLDHVLNVFFAE
ncbi:MULTISPECIES: FadR/GntR family transcriptional regulator [Halomonadaceae]|uniref:FadR family transcriptional regulator n=2 Tax=Vreelandella TaxID=3137766 RepID=A0A7Z0LRB2_9GAMM|nr:MULTISPECIES: FadR/GntR family transcriptional regulator [Halomonas]NYS77209.1 FadR family transcriptional regulator [Halomonas glaciei]|tara:strand:+ start:2957 stop:3712 length:756 start_codon:yes stop_codon:yes gene_type:complete